MDRDVFYKQGLTQPRHQMIQPLKVNAYYGWSVRTRTKEGVSPWSTYSGEILDQRSRDTVIDRAVDVAMVSPISTVLVVAGPFYTLLPFPFNPHPLHVNPLHPPVAGIQLVGHVIEPPNGQDSFQVSGRPFAFYTSPIFSEAKNKTPRTRLVSRDARVLSSKTP